MNGDKTGPEGKGPKTGRGFGYCCGNNRPGRDFDNSGNPQVREFGLRRGNGMKRQNGLGNGRGGRCGNGQGRFGNRAGR